MKITVIGGGSWATAITKILCEGNVQIKWWMRNVEDAEHIKKHHHNRNYLSSVEIHPSKVKPYTNLKEALRGTDWVVLAVPAAFVSDALKSLTISNLEDKKIISDKSSAKKNKENISENIYCSNPKNLKLIKR